MHINKNSNSHFKNTRVICGIIKQLIFALYVCSRIFHQHIYHAGNMYSTKMNTSRENTLTSPDKHPVKSYDHVAC